MGTLPVRPDSPRGALTRRAAAGVLALIPFFVLFATSLAAVRPAPNNPHGRFKGDCGQCHGSEGWTPVRISRSFDHSKFGFALDGAHAAVKCQACHATLDFTQSKTLCITCHQDPHRGELGTECARCHTSRSFVDQAGMRRAHQLSHFPLLGHHAGLECEACHPPAAQGKSQFVGTQAECQGCHMKDYQATTTPNHVAAGFPLECQTCHSQITWSTRTFDHNRTAFPLTGAHRTTPCQSCHGDGVYHGKSTDCYSCHKGNYDATSNPAHAGAGFSTQCATCHNTTSWDGATFNHDAAFFRIYSGTHRGRWSTCADCHTNAGNYAVFTCLSCHPHDDQATTNGHHSGVSGYRYDSASCYSCHR